MLSRLIFVLLTLLALGASSCVAAALNPLDLHEDPEDADIGSSFEHYYVATAAPPGLSSPADVSPQLRAAATALLSGRNFSLGLGRSSGFGHLHDDYKLKASNVQSWRQADIPEHDFYLNQFPPGQPSASGQGHAAGDTYVFDLDFSGDFEGLSGIHLRAEFPHSDLQREIKIARGSRWLEEAGQTLSGSYTLTGTFDGQPFSLEFTAPSEVKLYFTYSNV